MADVAPRDQNDVPALLGTSSVDGTPVKIYANPTTHRLLVDTAAGSGTVTSVSVVTANGFAGTVATATTTPAITLTTTATGLIYGNGTSIAAVFANPASDKIVGWDNIDGSYQPFTIGTGLTYTHATHTLSSSTSATSITVGVTTIASGTTTRILYDNAGVLGEYTLTGTGTVVAMQTSPVFVTDITTPVAKLSGTSNQLIFQSAGVTGIVTWTPTSSGKTVTIPDRSLTIDNITTATTTNGTGFLKGNGTVISFDNSTYITGLVVGTTTIGSGTTTRILYDNAGVLGEYTLTGSGTVVAMQTAPTFITSITVPLVIGGSGTTGTQLTLQTTTGNGTTDALVIKGGNNGASTFATFSLAALSIGTTGVFTTGTIELGAASDTTIARTSAGQITVEGVQVATTSNTITFTNKRITRRLVSTNAPGATPTTNTDNVDVQEFTGLATAITSMTTNLSGTPVDTDLLEFRFLDNGTARAITWGASFTSTTVTLPATTQVSTVLRVGFEWRGSSWACIATC